MQEQNKSLKTIAKGAGYVFVGLVISKLLTLVYRMIVARIGTEEYGVLSLGLAIVGILGFIPLLGLDQGILRYVPYYLEKNKIKKAKSTIIISLMFSLSLSIILAIIVFIFSKEISLLLFKNTELIPVLKILIMGLPFLVIGSLFLAVIRAFKNAKYFAIIKNITENVVKVILTFFLLLLGFELIGAATAYLIAIISTAVISFYMVKKNMLNIFSHKLNTYSKVKGLFSYSIPLMFHFLVIQVVAWTDILMIGFFRTESEVGIYNAAFPTATIASMVPEGIIILFIPVMVGLLAKNNMEEFKKTFKTSTNWIFIFNLPIFLIIALFSKQILKILFGQSYISGYIPLLILIPSYFTYHLFTTSSRVLNVLKKSKYLMINITIAAIINILLNYLLIPRTDFFGGMVGGAIATSTSLIIYGLLCGIESYYFTKINPFQRKQIKILFAGVISISIAYYFFNMIQNRTFINLGLVAILFILIYGTLILLLKCLTKYDYEIMNSMKSRIKSLLKF